MLLQQRIIWFALLASVLIYGFLIWFVVGPSAVDLKVELLQPFMLIVYGIALVTYVAAFLFSGALARRGLPRQTTLIVKLAMLEAVAIYGLVGGFLARDARLFVPTAALALVGMLRSFPLE